MSAEITFNPYVTTNAAGTFSVDTDGYIQGTALNDPSVRNQLAGGFVSNAESVPMWGGIGISETITPVGGVLPPKAEYGGRITRATSLTRTSSGGLTGFTVFDQAHAMVNTPQSPVPLAASGMSVNFYRLGSRARIAVACDPSLISLDGQIIGSQVSWDFFSQRLQPYVASGATEAVTSMTWSATNGGQVAVVMASASIYKLGDTINVSGVTNTGSGDVALINTEQVINTWTDSTHFTFLLPGDNTVWGTLGGTIVLNVGTGALACNVLSIQPTGCMTVDYDPATGFATWNRNGACAIIEI
jgi:hypothetical protein